jgi:hypothetical protein
MTNKKTNDVSITYNIFADDRIVSSFTITGKDEEECQDIANGQFEDFVENLRLEQE